MNPRTPSGRSVGARAGATTRGRAYLGLSLLLLAVAVLLIVRYCAAPTAAQAPLHLGSVPPATAVPGPSPSETTQPAQTHKPTKTSKAAASSSKTSTTAPRRSSPAPSRSTLFTAPASFAMKASAPLSIKAPTVNITSTLGRVGLNTDGTIEVPTDAGKAAWYRLGPTPGERGAAVIVGHLDSADGPAVFYRLGYLRPGQVIDITRADRRVAHFRIDAVNTYRRDHFPTQTVYGPVDYAGLRLITCGGTYDKDTKAYESNIVVFATLIHP